MNMIEQFEARKISLSILCVASAAITPTAAFAQEMAGDLVNDEIVVTATRRDLKLSDVPLSITALSQDTLLTRGIRDSSDIAYVAPGLSVVSDNSGTETVSVRGVVALGSTATTSFYIDETPISQIGGGYFSPRYFDIERVEVLRGPQGTLFGASSMGGGIRVITKQPSLSRFEGEVRAEGSTTHLGGKNYVVDGVVSVPIIENILGLRITGFYEKQAGWVKAFNPVFSDDPADYFGVDPKNLIPDPATGIPSPAPVNGLAIRGYTGTGKPVGDQTIYGGRASLLFQPSDVAKFRVTYYRQQRNNNGINSADNSIGLGLVGTQLRQARSVLDYRNRLSQLVNATSEFDLGFANLTSSTSYEWGRQALQGDFSGFAFPFAVAVLGTLPRDAKGQAAAAALTEQKNTDFTQEVRLVSSSDGPLNWILGGFYNKSRRLQDQTYTLSGLGGLTGQPNDNFANTSSDDQSREISFFAEAGYKFTETFSATLGLRRYSVRRSDSGRISGLVGEGTNSSPVVTESGFTYKAVIRYKPNNNLLLFAGYTTGYRPGGANVQSPDPNDVIPLGYKSDKLAQYELGWKANWLDRSLTFNGAFFYIDWSDIPTNVISPSNFGYTINGPKARNYGAEFEVTLRPTSGLNVSFGLTMLNAKYSREFVDTSGAGASITKGDRLPNVPDIALNAALDYSWSMGRNANARIGANIIHVTKRTQVINKDESLLPGLVNAGLLAGINFGKFDVSVFVRNLFDARALIGNFSTANEINGGVRGVVKYQSYIQPRTIGASVQMKF
jgi:iron complex outermembrane recepter protein